MADQATRFTILVHAKYRSLILAHFDASASTVRLSFQYLPSGYRWPLKTFVFTLPNQQRDLTAKRGINHYWSNAGHYTKK